MRYATDREIRHMNEQNELASLYESALMHNYGGDVFPDQYGDETDNLI